MAAEVSSLMRLLTKKQPQVGDQREDLPKFLRRGGGTLYDLNLPPPAAPAALNGVQQSSAEYQSVCTLEKVKSALERWHRPENSRGSTSPVSSSTTSSSLKRRHDDVEGESMSSPASEMVAAGCPSCLLYVLISSSKPRCPRCCSEVPLPLRNSKKQKIEVNDRAPLRTVKFF